MKKNKNHQTANEDIHDSARDEKYLRGDKATLDLPEVKDIPGQEHVRPPKLKEFTDTTISSADEEGKGILDFDEDIPGKDSNVSDEEKDLLEESMISMSTADDMNLKNASLDSKDDDGDELNEEDGLSGDDLDVPGSEDDDANEEIGEEDEENNNYSLGADKD
jgi:hypothetical protein